MFVLLKRKAKMEWQHWTASAIDCYNRGCVCNGCPTKAIVETPCLMKQSVLELVKQIGPPPKIAYIEGLTEQQERVVTAIINGAKTFEDIAKELKIKRGGVIVALGSIYPYYANLGFNYSSKRRQSLELISFINKYHTIDDNKNKERKIKMYFDHDLKLEYPEKYTGVISAIKKGYSTQNDIARESGIKSGTITWALSQIARYFELRIGQKSAKEALCDFIQKRLVDVHCGEAEDIPAETLPQITAAEPPKAINAQHMETEKTANPKMETQYIDTIAELKAENAELKAKIAELEKGSTFSAIKQKIKDKIETLNKQLELIEGIETL